MTATIGSVSAADQFTTIKGVKQFTTLNGVKAVPMSPAELNAVKGMDHHFFVLTTADNPNAILATVNGVQTYVLDPNASDSSGPLATDGRFGTDWKKDATGANSKGDNFVSITFSNGQTVLVSPAYQGLMNACGNGTIEGPGFLC
jgi:hypothetical protein